MICAHCGSGDTRALADRYLCSICARYTNSDGTKGVAGPQWTSPVPDAVLEDAQRTVDAAKAQAKK